jgi:hypothetical protein
MFLICFSLFSCRFFTHFILRLSLSMHVISFLFLITSLIIYTFAGRLFIHRCFVALHHGKKLHNTKYSFKKSERGATTEKDRGMSIPGVLTECANGTCVVSQAVRHMFECAECFCLNNISNLTSGLNYLIILHSDILSTCLHS